MTERAQLRFTQEEQARLARARTKAGAGYDGMSFADFIHHATMLAVDETLGTEQAARNGFLPADERSRLRLALIIARDELTCCYELDPRAGIAEAIALIGKALGPERQEANG